MFSKVRRADRPRRAEGHTQNTGQSGPQDLTTVMVETRQGSVQAFEQVYSQTRKMSHAILMGLLRDPVEAEEALQEVYVRVWTKSHQFNADFCRPEAWIATIARRVAIDRLRAGARKQTHDPFEDQVSSSASSGEMALVQRDLANALDYCLSELPEAQGLAVRRAYSEGSSYEELSQYFDVPLNTLKSWMRRSLIRLRACLKGQGEAP